MRALYVVVLTPSATATGDWQFFHATANLLARGHGYIDFYALLREGRDIPTALHPPLYSFALALVSRLGGTSELAHRLAGLGFGGGTIALVGLLGRRVAGERAGVAAAAIAAGYPVLIATDGALMSETLYALLVALVLLAAYAALDRPSAARAVGLGVSIGLASLTRSEALLLLPLLAIPLAARATGARLQFAAAAGSACLLVLAPWLVRNRLVFDRPILISSNLCGVIAGANCASTYDGPGLGGWDLACVAPRLELDEGVQAEGWCRDGLGFAAQNWTRLPAVVVARVLRAWGFSVGGDRSPGPAALRSVERLGELSFDALLLIAAGGAVVLRRRHEPVWILLLPAAIVVLTSALGWGLPAIRTAFEVPLVVLAAVGIAALAGWAFSRSQSGPSASVSSAPPSRRSSSGM